MPFIVFLYGVISFIFLKNVKHTSSLKTMSNAEIYLKDLNSILMNSYVIIKQSHKKDEFRMAGIT